MRYFLVFLLSILVLGSVSALTPKEQKGVKTLKSITIEYLSPDWFTPFVNIDSAPENIDYWTNLIPHQEDRNDAMYIVLPTLGMISPVISVPKDSADYTNMAAGKEIDINKYLNEGVMFYPRTGKIGQIGNPVIFGHSNFYKTGKGKYKTIFADIMNMDVGQEDEIWIYVKSQAGDYDLFKYRITESYETNPENVSILKAKGGKEVTVFACTDGLNGRWILRGILIEQDEMLILNGMRTRMDKVVDRLQKLQKEQRQQKVSVLLTKIQEMKDALPEQKNYAMKYRLYVLNYLEKRLIEGY